MTQIVRNGNKINVSNVHQEPFSRMGNVKESMIFVKILINKLANAHPATRDTN